MLVKSTKVDYQIVDLEEAFHESRHHQIKLNPNNYVFDVILGKFLVFMVTQREIKVNPKKIRALLEIPE